MHNQQAFVFFKEKWCILSLASGIISKIKFYLDFNNEM
jgi:hypothetical protein